MVNDYDKFAKMRQEQILRGEKRPHRFIEKPMMRSMLPDLTGKKVLMLGCGTGDESKLLEEYGATDIIGIDISEKSIEIATKSYPTVTFVVGDMHDLPFENETFDFVYSSLAIHYSEKPQNVYKEIYRILKDKGELLFSIGHPLRWASEDIEINNSQIKVIGYVNSSSDNKVIGKYHTFAKHEHKFPNDEVLSFYVGSPSMHFKLLKSTGFVIEDFTEAKCIEEAKELDFNYYAKYSEIPQFMAFYAKKSKKI